MSSVAVKRDIKIKAGVVSRTLKDISFYKKERDAQILKIEKMRSEGSDDYDIKKQEEVLAETNMMIPDCMSRLTCSIDSLVRVVDDAIKLNDSSILESDDMKNAVIVLENARVINC